MNISRQACTTHPLMSIAAAAPSITCQVRFSSTNSPAAMPASPSTAAGPSPVPAGSPALRRRSCQIASATGPPLANTSENVASSSPHQSNSPAMPASASRSIVNTVRRRTHAYASTRSRGPDSAYRCRARSSTSFATDDRFSSKDAHCPARLPNSATACSDASSMLR
jgi:hypothetical protein